jgi:flagellar hook-basal body complex protein FliE
VVIPSVAALGSILPSAMPAAMPAVSTPSSGAGFSQALADGLQKLQDLHSSSDNLAVKAATGDLTDVHDYMIAATEASVARELTVAVKNKAVEAFQEIMRMQM